MRQLTRACSRAGAHVGVAACSHGGNRVMIRNMLLVWTLTLPVATVFAFRRYHPSL